MIVALNGAMGAVVYGAHKASVAGDVLRRFRLLVIGVVAVALLVSVAALCMRLGAPITESFAFRQAQTAISALYILHGGPILAYETPVLGAPWSIPFEFPTYQVIVAKVAGVFGHIDAVGRIVSYVFLLLCIVPISLLYKRYEAPKHAVEITAALLLSSPIYLLYGGAFLIETTALFFSLAWLYGFSRVLHAPSAISGALCLMAGVLGILTKSTTFLPITIGAFVLMLAHIIPRAQARLYRQAGVAVALSGLMTLPVIAVGYAWVAWTDAMKERGALASHLTSSALSEWNFGSPGMRVSWSFWSTLWDRVPAETFGYGAIIAAAVVCAAFAGKGARLLAGASLATALAAFLLFPNLHYVHSYYQTAMAAFLIIPAGLGLAYIYERISRPVSVAAFVALVALQVAYAWVHVLPVIRAKPGDFYAIAHMAREYVPADKGLVVFGSDWSSEIPYYSERRSLAVPDWAPDDQLKALAERPSSFMGGVQIGGVVMCDTGFRAQAFKAAQALSREMALRVVEGKCGLWTPAPVSVHQLSRRQD